MFETFETIGACQIREPAFFGRSERNLWEALVSLPHLTLRPDFAELFAEDFEKLPLVAGVDNVSHRLVKALAPARFQDMRNFGRSVSRSGWNCRFHPIHLYGLLRDYSREEDLSLLLWRQGEDCPVTIYSEGGGFCVDLHHSCFDQEISGPTEIFAKERFIIGNAGAAPKRELPSRAYH